MKKTLLSIAGGALLAGCSVFGVRSGTEEPAYAVVDRIGGSVEVRKYGPRLAAEATVDAASEDAGRSAAFSILAGYIFGGNAGKTSIAMTAPVAIKPGGETIAMTAPVAIAPADSGSLTMRFFLPAGYTLASAPVPNDKRVHLLDVPEETVAVLGFTGSTGSAAVAEQESRLLKALGSSKWRPAGAPVALFYDPPWTLPFLRRNEVAVAVLER